VKKLFASLMTVALLGAVFVSPAQAAPKPKMYANCAAVLKVFPSGVAKTQAAARVAMADGKARPAVNKKTYDLNAKKLDRNGNLVLCEQVAAAPAAPVAVTGIKYTLTGIAIYDALNQSRADSGQITQAQSNALTRLGTAVTSPRQNTKVKTCPLWGFDVFRTGYLDSAITPQVLVAIGLTENDSAWAKDNLNTAVVSYCAQVS
jgi:hypothetical protein